MMFYIELIFETLRDLNFWSVTVRLVIAALFGGFIGSERGKHGRAAGLRTHILVCVGSAVTILVGLYTAQTLGFGNDPMRIGAQVISGIGFLGAGTILHHNHTHVTGLTTAAGLWTTASIGLAIGAGAYWISILAFIIMLITVALLNRLEFPGKKDSSLLFYIEVSDISQINEFTKKIADITQTLQIIPARSGLVPHVGLLLTVSDTCDEVAALHRFQEFEYVIIALLTSA